jgi:hypothetical protein
MVRLKINGHLKCMHWDGKHQVHLEGGLKKHTVGFENIDRFKEVKM